MVTRYLLFCALCFFNPSSVSGTSTGLVLPGQECGESRRGTGSVLVLPKLCLVFLPYCLPESLWSGVWKPSSLVLVGTLWQHHSLAPFCRGLDFHVKGWGSVPFTDGSLSWGKSGCCGPSTSSLQMVTDSHTVFTLSTRVSVWDGAL